MRRVDPSRRHAALAVAIAGFLLLASLFAFRPNERESRDTTRNSQARLAEEPSPDFGGPLPTELREVDRVAAPIRAESGGSLAGPSGRSRLEIPAGALDRDRTVEIVRHEVRDEEGLEFVFDLRPDGLAFARPVELALAIPRGASADEVEVAVFDPEFSKWIPEPDQEISPDAEFLLTRIEHFSLRRVRIRPGMQFPYDPKDGRGTFYLEADAGNTYERYLDGRWRAVNRRSGDYRRLMKLNRSGRHRLIVSGRLRAITAARPSPEVFRDHRRTVAMPAAVPEARTGWVKLTRLDAEGSPTAISTIARVNDYGPGTRARSAGVIVDMSRATMEALDLEWGVDFGLNRENQNLAWIRMTPAGGTSALRHVPLAIDAYDPQPARLYSCRIR